jgi:hypothetical protein
MMRIVPDKEKGYSKGTHSSILRVGLFVIAHVFHQLFDGDWFTVLILVAAGSESRLFDENVGVGCEAGDVTG